MSEFEQMDHDAAAHALDSVRSQRARAADRLVTPLWYHPTLGGLIGGLIASFEAGSTALTVLAFIIFALGTGLLVHAYRRTTGVWVSGLRRGPAGRVAVLLVGLLYAVAAAAFALHAALDVTGAFLVGGILAAVLVMVLGRRFDKVLRAELRATP